MAWGHALMDAVRSTMPISAPGMLIKRGIYGTRYIAMETGGRVYQRNTTTLLPFTVRWLDYGKNDNGSSKGGQWQIYLPLGCMTICQHTRQGDTTTPYIMTNAKASDANGNDIPGWYAIPEPKNGVDDYTYTADGVEYREWVLSVYQEPWPRANANAMPSEMTKVFLWSVAVATLTVATRDKGQETESVTRYATRILPEDGGPLTYREWDASTDFAIRYEFAEGEETDPTKDPNVYVANQERYLGRLDKVLTGDKNITSWTGEVKVFLKVTHSSEVFGMSVERDLENDDAVSDDDKTVGQIYTIKDAVVTSDNRSQFPSTVFYNSPEPQAAPEPQVQSPQE